MQFYPDYQKPIREALCLLEDSGIDRFPVSLHAIQRQFCNLFVIRSYESFMADMNCSREDCCKYLGSDDGAAVFDGCSKYIVYYNETNKKQRTRFTIAHEIGHIILDHHQELGVSIIGSGGLGKALYDRLEKEADCFARNLLSPASSAEELLGSNGFVRTTKGRGGCVYSKAIASTGNPRFNIGADTLIVRAFDISAAAAKTRISLLSTDLSNSYKDRRAHAPMLQFMHSASWYCSRCGLERLPGVAYCPECGKRHFVFHINASGSSYKANPQNECSQFSYCPVCGNARHSCDAGYCRICGTPVSNPCTSDPTHLNHPEAKYCKICGKPTIFSKTEHHLRVKAAIAKMNEGDFPMIYESDIKFDPETNKVAECPRCHNELFGVDASYCRICGLVLKNTCIPEPEQDSYGNYYDPEPHQNPPDARFCETCGAPTVYLSKGILKSYEEVWKELRGEDIDDRSGIPF